MKPKIGFVLGKFMPPHTGHVYMCEFARNYCEKLTILVCSQPSESIPGRLRFQWMREMFPDCDVQWYHEEVQQEPTGPEDTHFWNIWRNIVQIYNEAPDVVFASEDYGHRLSAEVGAYFVPVDIDRISQPISGTAIRENPFKNWKYIPNVVRPFYTKRAVMFGPESSGKSTLGLQLARHFDTVFVPEYGRTYTEAFGPKITAEDLRQIVAGHTASLHAAKRQANRLVIEDTDPLMTAVWAEMLLKRHVPELENFQDYGDLYLLTKPDIPWVDDGTRYFPSEEERWKFYDICEQKLISRGVKYAVIEGDAFDRLENAVSAIRQHLF